MKARQKIRGLFESALLQGQGLVCRSHVIGKQFDMSNFFQEHATEQVPELDLLYKNTNGKSP
ncbi:hypothetical protein A3848_18155 [Paenibacillus sp. P32E]|nr:hypothetical protein A3848_18155 [Paenibacillus sp. P32E]